MIAEFGVTIKSNYILRAPDISVFLFGFANLDAFSPRGLRTRSCPVSQEIVASNFAFEVVLMISCVARLQRVT